MKLYLRTGMSVKWEVGFGDPSWQALTRYNHCWKPQRGSCNLLNDNTLFGKRRRFSKGPREEKRDCGLRVSRVNSLNPELPKSDIINVLNLLQAHDISQVTRLVYLFGPVSASHWLLGSVKYRMLTVVGLMKERWIGEIWSSACLRRGHWWGTAG